MSNLPREELPNEIIKRIMWKDRRQIIRESLQPQCSRDAHRDLVHKLFYLCESEENPEECTKEKIHEYAERCRKAILDSVDVSGQLFENFNQVLSLPIYDYTQVHLILNPDATLSVIMLKKNRLDIILEIREHTYHLPPPKKISKVKFVARYLDIPRNLNLSLSKIESIDTLRNHSIWNEFESSKTWTQHEDYVNVANIVRAIKAPQKVQAALRKYNLRHNFQTISPFEVVY